jgi:hypothetical protein
MSEKKFNVTSFMVGSRSGLTSENELEVYSQGYILKICSLIPGLQAKSLGLTSLEFQAYNRSSRTLGLVLYSLNNERSTVFISDNLTYLLRASGP